MLAVIQPMIYLQEQGFEVSYIPVDRYGRIDLQKFSDAIREDTILVSTMYVNNEIGTLEPIEEIGKIIKEKIQRHSGMWMQSRPMESTVFIRKNLALICSRSADISCMDQKGVGFLYVRNGVKIHPLILGGGQQKGMRSGTDNVPGIAGLGCANKRSLHRF